MRIGIVDLDTSHPQSFLPLLRARGHEVVGVWDEGKVRPAGYAELFTRKNDIPRVFASLEEMAGQVDCAMLHGCDWDTHVAKALPFLEQGKSVFIDKPLAGNATDLATIAEWVAQGRRVAGGSSLLYCREAKEWKGARVETRGALQAIFCGCSVDLFNYGIHAYALASALADAPVTSVRYLGPSGRQAAIELVHADGMRSSLQIGPTGAWLPFYATLVTTRQVKHVTVDASALYATALDATFPFLERKMETPPLAVDAWLQPERCALAALLSQREGGRKVGLGEAETSQASHDGSHFARVYRDIQYPKS